MKKRERHSETFEGLVVTKERDTFLAWAKRRKYSPQTLQSYEYSFKTFFSFLAERGIKRVQDVTEQHVDAWRVALIDKDYKPNTVEIHLTNIRAFYKWMEKQGDIFVNPFAGLIVPRPDRPILHVPAEKEVKKLLAQPDVSTPRGLRDRAFMETAYSTGARREELCALSIFDPDLKEGRLRILGKGKKERVVPLGKHAVYWIGQYLKHARPKLLKGRVDQTALWIGFKGRKLDATAIAAQMGNYSAQAGIPRISPHSLRRACVTHMLRGGAHPVQLQMLLGHASLNMLSQYLRVSITEMMKMHKNSKPGR
jgi:integrase/recombinase XerD